MGWRRSEMRRWVKKARKRAERRTEVDIGKVVASRTVGTAKNGRTALEGIDRLV
jgi:hypothetical protein